ncbi:28S ribosomal protein S26, mitochondrial [Alosa sapidissima]|uniref:28S ribosomal protein S26, mitochondrial n=1 Tax=Alosa sapidissima TaxID=34773 RepID=UPI001C088CBB|nr:28S ribosomal protein S26, mitochondrial [Alosa sapidissima]
MFQALGRTARAPVARILAPRAVLVETVRGRKSRNDPKAKSKAGRIKYPPPVDPVEMVILKERFIEYNLIMRALRMQFKEEMLRRRYDEETGSLAEERAKQEAEEHRALMEWNNQENDRLRKIREVRVQQEQEESQRMQMEVVLERQRELDELVKEKESEILRLQEEAKTFITMENLDQRIEDALDNPQNYNFAIDKEGRVVKQTVMQ